LNNNSSIAGVAGGARYIPDYLMELGFISRQQLNIRYAIIRWYGAVVPFIGLLLYAGFQRPVLMVTFAGSFAAIIVPSGMVSDRLRYTEDVTRIPPATALLKRAFSHKDILKGIICHGMWLAAPAPELVRGRRVTVHNNLIGDARNMGAVYVDEDVVVDDDLVTGRTGGHCHLFARKIIDILAAR